MKTAISNIAWQHEDEKMLETLHHLGIQGLEIAPTRLISQDPYDSIEKAAVMSQHIHDRYKLTIPSMQSIWFGRSEQVFKSKDEQESLIAYTEKAIAFAAAIQCKSLVFGNPKARNYHKGGLNNAEFFFKTIADMAHKKGVVIALEANPTLYGTHFMTTTSDAISFVKMMAHPGLKLNLDIGTMIANHESASLLKGNIALIQHVHISEPYLELINPRDLHKQVLDQLADENYSNYVAIEMKTPSKNEDVIETLMYLQKLIKPYTQT
jgi:sugar phosphate isomerase/epimerase